MNLTVLLIAAWVPLVLIMFMLMRSGSFGKGSLGTLLKLFFLGVAASVPAFLMEAGALLALTLLIRLFPETAFGGHLPVASVILRYMLVVGLIEETWKHFVLRYSTWEKMTMETVADGIAASGVVSAGFAALIYGFWQAGGLLADSNLNLPAGTMPEFLSAGPVVSFLYALLFVFSHFGFSGLMGALYGVAKRSEQKMHRGRAGFMLFVSFLLPVLVHGICAALIAYGIATGSMLWLVLGFGAQTILALLISSALISAADDSRTEAYEMPVQAPSPVDFADSEEFAEFAENEGRPREETSAGKFSEESSAGEPPAGHLPMGQDPAGLLPLGQDPAGHLPPGQDSAGLLPPGQDPAGHLPMGQDPAGDLSGGQSSPEQISET